MWVSLAFIAGILLAKLVSLPLYVWLIFALLTFVTAIFRYRSRNRFSTFHLPFSDLQLSDLKPSSFTFPSLTLTSACMLALFLGAFRYQTTVPEISISQIAWFNDRDYDTLVTGTLVEPPDYRDTYTNLRLRVEQVDTGEHAFKVSGLLLARVHANQTYHYGDIIRLRGRLQTPPEDEDFSYRDFLAREGIRSYVPNADATFLPGNQGNPFAAFIYRIKEKSLDNVYRLFLDPEASLLAGILLGVDSDLSFPLQQAFKNTGTAHIIAISGFNIAIIAGIFIKLFSRILGPRRGAVVAVLGIGLYTFLVGANASVVRAALMGTLSLFAVQVGRRQQGLNTLAFVGALMAVFNPLVLWDVGFQLSFFATLGLVLYGEVFLQVAEKFFAHFFPVTNTGKISQFFADFVLLTFAAQLTTLPIVAYQFKQVSLVSFAANPFILPAQPAVMILGGQAVLASFLLFPLGQAIAWAAWPLTAYTIRMVEFFNGIPHGVIYLGGFSFGFVVLYYAVLFTFTFGGSSIKNFFSAFSDRFRFLSAASILAVLFILTMLIWRLVAVMPDGKLHITFLNVGSADAVLIETPAGRNILVNGGPSASSLSDALGRRLSPLDHSLDWLILASTKEDQVASLPRLLPRYPPKKVLLGANQGASYSSEEVLRWLAEGSVPVTRAEQGQTLDLGKGATLKMVDISSGGATLLIEWEGFRCLLPIGENFDTLERLQFGKTIGPVNILSLSQSGYAGLTPPDLINNLDPQLTVLSVAAGDPDGLPDAATLNTLGGRSLVRTDLNGWIEIKTDGKQMWIRVERK